jgi:hypothetical protein
LFSLRSIARSDVFHFNEVLSVYVRVDVISCLAQCTLGIYRKLRKTNRLLIQVLIDLRYSTHVDLNRLTCLNILFGLKGLWHVEYVRTIGVNSSLQVFYFDLLSIDLCLGVLQLLNYFQVLVLIPRELALQFSNVVISFAIMLSSPQINIKLINDYGESFNLIILVPHSNSVLMLFLSKFVLKTADASLRFRFSLILQIKCKLVLSNLLFQIADFASVGIFKCQDLLPQVINLRCILLFFGLKIRL